VLRQSLSTQMHFIGIPKHANFNSNISHPFALASVILIPTAGAALLYCKSPVSVTFSRA
jgi:hypothetical protein